MKLNQKKLPHNQNSVSFTKTGVDWWDYISNIEKENIELGLKDIEEGRVLSSEQFWKKLKSNSL